MMVVNSIFNRLNILSIAGYNFCRIEAIFGEDHQKEIQTKWITKGPTGFCDGCGNRKIGMKKIV